MYPEPIEQLIRSFSKLPTVGQRTAERFVFYLLKSGKKDVAELTLSLKKLIETIKSCNVCWDFSDQSPCMVCSDKKRDTTKICVVVASQDVQVIEKTNAYAGLYHVLRGVINPAKETKLHHLKIKELIHRIKTHGVTEVILGLSPDMTGETTMMFLEQHISREFPSVKITRLARGLPMGSDLQYADEITLASALKHRTSTKK